MHSISRMEVSTVGERISHARVSYISSTNVVKELYFGQRYAIVVVVDGHLCNSKVSQSLLNTFVTFVSLAD